MPNSLHTLLDDTLAGHRLTEEEAVRLLSTRGREVWAIAAAADELRARRVGDTVTYVRNQNINVTNLCVNACGFCGFSRKSGDADAFFTARPRCGRRRGRRASAASPRSAR